MPIGWIRAYKEEDKAVGTDVTFFEREERAKFRKAFKTLLFKREIDTSETLKTLKWGEVVRLPDGLSSTKWTKVISGRKTGFVLTKHVVEVAFAGNSSGKLSSSWRTKQTYRHFNKESKTYSDAKRSVVSGELAQITKRGRDVCHVRLRGIHGTVPTADLQGESLLEVYFIDVGQGDGVLIRTPDFRHILVDGGLPRMKQQTGKSAADFVDWKFFFDYGDYRVRLESMMASHSDLDHYGGLHDLIETTALADRELDCLGVDIKTFHHPGLSRWSNVKNAVPKHADGLGPKLGNGFIRLLDDRTDAEAATGGNSPEQLSGPWGRFITDVLKNAASTKFERVGVSRADLRSDKPLPDLWRSSAGCNVKVLGPVTYDEQGRDALKDLGNKGKNSNGHSICLRLEYGKARILVAGDLNTKAMNWLEDCYDARMSAFACDVAKACHHGSEDISYRFLEAINAAATVISSGDAEGHAHPRPEIVAASACSGHINIDREKDKLLTPLVYMTEIERSVTLGAINRMDIENLSSAKGDADGVILGRPTDEMNARAFLSPNTRKQLVGVKDTKARTKIAKKIQADEIDDLASTENDRRFGEVRIDMNLTIPLGPVETKNLSKRAWRARMMESTHYGLVTVRTDGDDILCTTLDEKADDWIAHTFPARFADLRM